MGDNILIGLRTSRRLFLKGLAVTSAAVGVGTTMTGCSYEKAPEGLLFLDEKGYAVIRAFADRVVPRGGPFPEGALDTGVVEFFDAFAAASYPEVRKDLKSAITVLEHGPIVLAMKAKRFTQMTASEQDDYLTLMQNSGSAMIRGLFVGFKRVCFMGFYVNEKVWPSIGYDGPWV